MIDLQTQAHQQSLYASEKCMDYLSERKVSPDAIHKYQIGYYVGNTFDAYNDRMMFPIRNEYGVVQAYQARAMYDWKDADKPKYYHGSYEKAFTVYGLFECAELASLWNTVVVVEGPFDVFACYMAGIPAVAMLGTSFSTQQLLILKRYVNKLIVWVDPDKAGIQATKRLIEISNKVGLDLTVMPRFGYNHQDPADIWADDGVQAFAPFTAFFQRYARQLHDSE